MNAEIPTRNPPRSAWVVVASLAFLLTGIGVVLPGALLPSLLAVWRLSDSHGGAFLMANRTLSTVAAMAVRGRPGVSATWGLLAVAVALAGMAFAPGRLALAVFALFGFGLGLVMTGISMARCREVAREDCSRELNRLNMLWAVGACLTPAIALHSLRSVSVRTTFGLLAVLFGVVMFVFAMQRPREVAARREEREMPMERVPWIFCLVAALAVGVESCIGAWLTTYVARAGHAAAVAASANTFFWAGILLSRAAHAHRAFGFLRAARGLALHLVLTLAATVLLLMVGGMPVALLAVAFAAGFGVGPLYPSVLAMVVPRFRSNMAFVCAGVGSALCPWLVGAVSSESGSLRVAMVVVCGLAGVLVVSACGVWRKSEGLGFRV